MRKIPTIFERDWNGGRSLVVNEPNAECVWVFNGEGSPTIKVDGTCCMVRDGGLYKRREVKAGEAPADFELADFDEVTLKSVGWVPIGDGPEDKWHREAFCDGLSDGTYELLGPKIQGNPESMLTHELVAHGSSGLIVEESVPRDFEGLKAWLSDKDMEGLVFHHPDGRMAKIKLRDFGLKRASAT